MNDELIHIGMPRRSGRYRWGSGKRPYQSSGGVGPKTSSSSQPKKVRIKDVSDEDLQKRINRLNLENSYYDAMKKYRANTKKENRVKKVVKDILEDSSKTLAKELIGAYARNLGKELFPNQNPPEQGKKKK